ncbi:MAG: DNA helicase RecQ, partial [Duncaniella sp.]|nr:DNA helicase RecQ [Duncaniella sp.]
MRTLSDNDVPVNQETIPADNELSARATALLARFYGYGTFRPLQFEIISTAVARRDSVVLMPTGGGKSVCYQLPALISEGGVTVVVSPLIALMKDQVAALVANGIPAAAVNSLQSEEENRHILEQLATGRIKLLYISPERLLTEIDRWSRDLPIVLFAIDEAHCISQWGHDFRPGYTQLSRIKEVYPEIPVMALTATADRITREDIATQLRLRDPAVFIGSFDRPNISLRVIVNPGKTQRLAIIGSLIERHRMDSGIVYCISRKGAEDTARQLAERGYRAGVYHAGLSTEERNRAQERFINGDLQVICATVAFGMGIDKSNIRWVVHNNMPRNIESYYQEIGRAGRDGAPAETIMFYSYGDIATLRSFVDESGQQALNAEKLARMQQYAEASLCRRRILLSYFNETMDHDCGNCDICLHPPQRFDATIHVQKALSAVVRLNGQAGITMLIDVLRGMARQDLIQRGFHQIKTYGAGRDLSFAEWNAYITQMIQLGLLDVAYNESNHLKITPYGTRILMERQSVELAVFTPQERRTSGRRRAAEVEAPKLSPAEILMETLKEVRLKQARAEQVPPYLVLTDKTLMELVRVQPTDMEAFARIEGIGERKTVKYWRPFVTAIRKHLGIREKLGSGLSESETLLLLGSGYDIPAIAEAKGIKTQTVYNHIATLIGADRLTDFSSIITREQYLRVMEVARENPSELYIILANEMPLGLPKVAL